MTGQQTTLTFGGDAQALLKASKQVEGATGKVGDSVGKTGDQMKRGNEQSRSYSARLGDIGALASGMSSAIDDAGSSVQALADFQDRDRAKAMAHARALADVEQASLDAEQAAGDLQQANEDLSQSFVDAKQGASDAARAQTDIKRANAEVQDATTALNQAIKEHGRNSKEARDAALDLEDAQHDVTDANIAAEQAQRDISQANLDGGQASRDAAQAVRDGKDAQLDMNEAWREAHPTSLQNAAGEASAYASVLSGAAGAVSLLGLAYEALNVSAIKSTASLVASKAATLATAAASGIATVAQGIWNVVTWAFPGLLIVAAIAAIIAAIVWIATKTTWFQDLWKVTWESIKAVAGAVWSAIKWAAQSSTDFLAAIPGKIGRAFSAVTNFLFSPFKQAFNKISDAWNATVGRMRWQVPDWVPGIGGNSISAPRLPHFHTGGKVPGLPGSEMLAVVQAGETITSNAGGSSGGMVTVVIRSDGSRFSDLVLALLRDSIDIRGGNVQVASGRLV